VDYGVDISIYMPYTIQMSYINITILLLYYSKVHTLFIIIKFITVQSYDIILETE
jgi:Na+/serine symporter